MTTAVVTGASRGVGKGIARALGAAGHEVYVTGRSTGSAVTHPVVGGTVEQTAAEVDAAGGRGVPVVCDHTDDDQVRALFDRVARESGGLDLLVNNVWGGYAAYHEDRYADMSGPFWSQPLRVWDEMFQAGVRAHYAATVLAVPLLRPGGLVVTISFFPGSYLNGDDQVAYSVAKAADDRMVAVMAAPAARARRHRGSAVSRPGPHRGCAAGRRLLRPVQLGVTGVRRPGRGRAGRRSRGGPVQRAMPGGRGTGR